MPRPHQLPLTGIAPPTLRQMAKSGRKRSFVDGLRAMVGGASWAVDGVERIRNKMSPRTCKGLRMAVLFCHSSVVSIIFFGLLFVILDPFGIPDRIMGTVAGVGTTQSAPVNIQWRLPAANPVTAPGWTADGRFDHQRLLASWRSQHLPKERLEWARYMLYDDYVTLYLRHDPVLDATLTSDEDDERESWREHETHGAWFRSLEDKTVTPPDDEEEVSAPTDSLARDLQWREFDEGFGELLNTFNPGMVLPMSLDHAWLTWMEYNAAQPESARMVIPDVLNMGLDAHGVWSSKLLLATWRARGIAPVDAEVILEKTSVLLRDWSSPATPQGELRRRTLAAEVAAELNHTYATQLATRPRAEPATPPVLVSVEASLGPHPLNARLAQAWDWHTQDKDRRWEQLAATLPVGEPLPAAPALLDMEQAKRELEQAALAVGLRSLRLPLVLMDSPQRLWYTAQMLRRANQELETVSGWKGGVLGFNGRLELTLASPALYGASGMVVGSWDGRLQMMTEWTAIGHEWFHVVDILAAQQALSRPVYRYPLTSGLRWAEGHRLPAVIAATEALREAVEDPKSAWFQARDKKGFMRWYWRRPSEASAFGFDAYLTTQGLGLLSNASIRLDRARDPQRVPTEQDIAAMGQLYQNLFRSLDGMDWTGVDSKSVHQVAQDPGLLARWWRQDTI